MPNSTDRAVIACGGADPPHPVPGTLESHAGTH